MSEIIFYQNENNQIEVRVDQDTVWLNRQQLSSLFDRDIKTIGKHVNNVFHEGELDKEAVVAKFATTAADGKAYQVEYYNLDVIISVGYRVKSQRGTQFRQWATRRLKDYLVQGYAINQKRLEQKQQEVQYLKSGIRILSRAIEERAAGSAEAGLLQLFGQGLALLDDYDHETLDTKGLSHRAAYSPGVDEYMDLIVQMKTVVDSDLFGLPKDESFNSSINQVMQSFNGKDLYPSLEEKAAVLLYLIVKNHSFADGNKRIAAACFLLFLEKNDMLLRPDGQPLISNEALAALTLFVATSRSDEMKTVVNLIVSVLNRSGNGL